MITRLWRGSTEQVKESDVLTTIVKPVGTRVAMVGYNNKLYLIGVSDSIGDPTNGIIEFY